MMTCSRKSNLLYLDLHLRFKKVDVNDWNVNLTTHFNLAADRNSFLFCCIETQTECIFCTHISVLVLPTSVAGICFGKDGAR